MAKGMAHVLGGGEIGKWGQKEKVRGVVFREDGMGWDMEWDGMYEAVRPQHRSDFSFFFLFEARERQRKIDEWMTSQMSLPTPQIIRRSLMRQSTHTSSPLLSSPLLSSPIYSFIHSLTLLFFLFSSFFFNFFSHGLHLSLHLSDG
jgi:hypothetical protein